MGVLQPGPEWTHSDASLYVTLIDLLDPEMVFFKKQLHTSHFI